MWNKLNIDLVVFFLSRELILVNRSTSRPSLMQDFHCQLDKSSTSPDFVRASQKENEKKTGIKYTLANILLMHLNKSNDTIEKKTTHTHTDRSFWKSRRERKRCRWVTRFVLIQSSCSMRAGIEARAQRESNQFECRWYRDKNFTGFCQSSKLIPFFLFLCVILMTRDNRRPNTSF